MHSALCFVAAKDCGRPVIPSALWHFGLKAALPSSGANPLSIEAWQEHVLETTTVEEDLSHIGRMWEQLAADIFVANLPQPCWAWVSHWRLLEFWAAFEPRIRFVLMGCSPEEALIPTLVQEDLWQPETTMEDWATATAAMLRFFHRHSSRCLLVDAQQAATAPQALVAAMRSLWHLPLDVPVPENTVADTPPSLDRYFARLWLQSQLHIHAIYREFLASYHPLLPETEQEIVNDARQLLDAWRAAVLEQLQKDTICMQHGQKLKVLEAELASHAVRDAEQRQTIIELQKNIADIKKACGQLQHALQERDAALAQVSSVRQDLEARVNELQEEGELILSQLHQVQEELERYILEYQTAQQEINSWRQRWERMCAHNPHICVVDAMEATPQEDGSIAWRITQWEDGTATIPVLEFSTFVDHGVAGFLLDHSRCPKALLRWPATQQSVIITPVATPETISQRLHILKTLASSDWRRLRLLAQRLSQASYYRQLPAKERQRHDEAWQALIRIMDSFASVLRYDGVTLVEEVHHPQYEHLEMQCHGVYHRGVWWPQVTFRLACAAITPESFGQHPRIQFPQGNGQDILTSWFAETTDALGPRLELRFAEPDAMDMHVWACLAEEDQDLVRQWVQHLPRMLELARDAGASILRPWEDWLVVAQSMGRILELHTSNAAPALQTSASPHVEHQTSAGEDAASSQEVVFQEDDVLPGPDFERIMGDDFLPKVAPHPRRRQCS